MKSYLLGTIHLTGNNYWLTRFFRYYRCSLTFSLITTRSDGAHPLAAIRESSFDWPVHTIVTYRNLRHVCKFWHLIVDSEKAKRLLQQVYVPYTNVLSKSWLGIRVNMQRIIRNTGSFSGLVLELKRIIENHWWNKAWLDLILLSDGW